MLHYFLENMGMYWNRLKKNKPIRYPDPIEEENPQEKVLSHREQERRLPKWAKTCRRKR